MRPERVGMLGCCFGGGVTWWVAIGLADVSAAVPFYGPHPDPAELESVQAAATDAWARWGGLGLTLAGFALLRWSHHQALGKKWSDRPRITQGQQLVTDGPYRRIRHPIYTAFLLILGSSLFVSGNWFIGGLWIAMTGLNVRSRIAFEEDRMLARFGDEYRSYKARTGSLIPWSDPPSKIEPA